MGIWTVHRQLVDLNQEDFGNDHLQEFFLQKIIFSAVAKHAVNSKELHGKYKSQLS